MTAPRCIHKLLILILLGSALTISACQKQEPPPPPSPKIESPAEPTAVDAPAAEPPPSVEAPVADEQEALDAATPAIMPAGAGDGSNPAPGITMAAPVGDGEESNDVHMLLPGGRESDGVERLYKISCPEPGIYRVTGWMLGHWIEINPDKLVLLHNNVSVPIYVEQAKPGVFEFDDAIYFYAIGPHATKIPFVNVIDTFAPKTQDFILLRESDKYEPLRYERIELPRGEGAPAPAARAVAGGSIHLEENPLFEYFFNERVKTSYQDSDFQFWHKLTYPETTGTSSEMELELKMPEEPAQGEARLTIQFAISAVNRKEPVKVRHRVHVALNDKVEQEIEWLDDYVHKATVVLPEGTWQPGANKLHLTLNEPIYEPKNPQAKVSTTTLKLDMLYLDYIELEYPQQTSIASGYNEFIFSAAPGRPFSIGQSPVADPLLIDLARRRAIVGAPAVQDDPKSGLYSIIVDDPTMTSTTLVALARDKARSPQITSYPHTRHFEEPDDCDLLIVSHPDFLETLAPLVEWKRQRGLKVSLVNVMELFNENGGYASPLPIRDYIRHVHLSQDPPRLKYVMLVGDATPASKYKSFIPIYEGVFSGTHANENFFANYKDPAQPPIVSMGRLPIRNNDELRNIVNKIIAYERMDDVGVWRSRMLMIAASAEWASNAATSIDQRYIRPEFISSFLRVNPFNSDPAYHEKCSTELINLLNGGNLVTMFLGHGGGGVWEIGPGNFTAGVKTNLFNYERVAELTNEGRPTLVMALTCYTGSFGDAYKADSIGEAFLTSTAGAIGVIGTVGVSDSSSHIYFAQNFFRLLKAGDQPRLGDLMIAAEKPLGRMREYHMLLGDPSLEFRLPTPAIEIRMPGDPLPATTTAQATSPGGKVAEAIAETAAGLQPGSASVTVSADQPTTDGMPQFQFLLPTTATLPAELRCAVLDTNNELLKTWTEVANAHSGYLTDVPTGPILPEATPTPLAEDEQSTGTRRRALPPKVRKVARLSITVPRGEEPPLWGSMPISITTSNQLMATSQPTAPTPAAN